VFSHGHDGLLEFIGDLAERHGIRYLLAIGEGDLQFFNANRERLLPLKCLFPDSARLERALNKDLCCQIARRIGVETPAIYEISDPSAVATMAIDYPVVLKWSNPHAVVAKLHEHELELRKMEYCYDAAELERTLDRYAPVGQFPLVQSFCPGYGLGQMLFMYRGVAELRFQHRRINEWPPEGGSSTLCESVHPNEHAELMEKSEELLRQLDWEGPAMVEYRFDPQTSRAVLMEINGRFWGSQPLAYHAGAPFAWFSYKILGLSEIPTHHGYRAGLKCSYLIPELKRLARILFQPQMVQDRALKFDRKKELAKFVLNRLDPRLCHYLFSLDDPWPALRDTGFAFMKLLRGVV
jgi:predicted ATP-grasp superfamily ATP-dependent carboligase